MRISAEIDDPGYENYIKNPYVTVLLNGVVQKDCVTADTDAGIIKRSIRDENGYFVVINDEVQNEVVYGKVKIYD